MVPIKSTFKRWDGENWNVHYFRTSADIIDETETKKILTSTERANLTLLESFNGADKLLQLNGSGLIPVALIPGGLDYLTTNNPTYTGAMTAGGNFNLLGNALSLGQGAANTTTLTKWEMEQVGTQLRFRHDIGAGMVYSFAVTKDVFDMGGKKIVTVGTPTANTDAATKGYVDGLVSAGFAPKEPVMAASTANISIASALSKLDGYTLSANDRVLLKNQDTATENGVYQLNATKVPVKVAADSGKGSSVFIEHGDTQNDNIYVSSTANTWVIFSRVDTITPGAGLSKSGNSLLIGAGKVTNDMLGGNIALSKLSPHPGQIPAVAWTGMHDEQDGGSVVNMLNNFQSAIKLLRGSASYKTNNSQTIAGAYTEAKTKNRTYTGASDPGTTGFVAGDLYFQNLT